MKSGKTIIDTGDIYLLTDVSSKMLNPVHDEIIGRFCRLSRIQLGEPAWVRVKMDRNWHTLRTTSVIDVEEYNEDDGRSVCVTTDNSCYTFKFVKGAMHGTDYTRCNGA